ncbi:MAG: hypothetical protein R3C17_17035 [Planctomycetaceae bacterium]
MTSSDSNLNQEYNPFAAPTSGFEYPAAGVGGDAERIRTELISHEASIKSIGVLYLLGAVFGTLAGIFLTVTAVYAMAQDGAQDAVVGLLAGIFITGLSLGQGFVGFGLRRLRGWTRIPVGILSGIGLLGFPVGTLINGYILYLIFSQKGSRVFAPEYQAIIQQTPHIKYQTSIIVKIFLVFLLAMIGFIILAAIFAG